MGNRAVITFARKEDVAPFFDKEKNDGMTLKGYCEANPYKVGVYVHWNGGKDSIVPFLDACRQIGYHDPVYCHSYGIARVVQLIANFFGGTDRDNVGVDVLDQLDTDNYDNGVFVVGEDFSIIGREFARERDEELDKERTESFTAHLVKQQKGVDAVCKALTNGEVMANLAS